MSKKILLLLLIFITVGLLAYVFSSARKKQVDEKINSPVIEEKSDKLLTYNDPTGFSFSYPEKVQITAIETVDNDIYSSLNLSAKEKQGNISVEVITSDLQKIDDWFTRTNFSGGKNLSGLKKLKIADLDARQFKEEGKLTTIALDPGVLFTITVDYKTEKDFWEAVNNQVIASFVFLAPESQKASTANGSGTTSDSSDEDVIFEGEEIVE